MFQSKSWSGGVFKSSFCWFRVFFFFLGGGGVGGAWMTWSLINLRMLCSASLIDKPQSFWTAVLRNMFAWGWSVQNGVSAREKSVIPNTIFTNMISIWFFYFLFFLGLKTLIQTCTLSKCYNQKMPSCQLEIILLVTFKRYLIIDDC